MGALYHSGNNGGDIAGSDSNWAWGAMILPMLEQSATFDALNVGDARLPDQLANATTLEVMQTPISVFRCPSDPGSNLNNERGMEDSSGGYGGVPTGFITGSDPRANGTGLVPTARSNYVAMNSSFDPSIGSGSPTNSISLARSNGMFTIVTATYNNSNDTNTGTCRRMRDITDGTSNTIAIGERASVLDGNTHGAANIFGIAEAGMRSWWGVNDAMAGGTQGINLSTTQRARGLSSLHSGGVQVLLADGSVRFISENINHVAGGAPNSVYENLICYNDGNVIGEF